MENLHNEVFSCTILYIPKTLRTTLYAIRSIMLVYKMIFCQRFSCQEPSLT